MKTVEHNNSEMKNVTITMDEEVARWARIRAAELETSVSRLVGQMLKEKMLVDQTYEKARDRYLAQPPKALKKAKEKYPARQDLYDRRSSRGSKIWRSPSNQSLSTIPPVINRP